MNTWVWHKVGLELGDVNVECTIKSEGSSQGGDHLRDKTVQVGVGWALDAEAATADVIDSLVVKHDGEVGVLKERVASTALYGSTTARGWVDTESSMDFLP